MYAKKHAFPLYEAIIGLQLSLTSVKHRGPIHFVSTDSMLRNAYCTLNTSFICLSIHEILPSYELIMAFQSFFHILHLKFCFFACLEALFYAFSVFVYKMLHA